MDLKLKGKTALVTGSASGIGYAIALGLAKEGVIQLIKLILLYITRSKNSNA